MDGRSGPHRHPVTGAIRICSRLPRVGLMPEPRAPPVGPGIGIRDLGFHEARMSKGHAGPRSPRHPTIARAPAGERHTVVAEGHSLVTVLWLRLTPAPPCAIIVLV